MAKKKSFNTDLTEALNPAMQFISAPAQEKREAQEQPTGDAPEGYYTNPLYIEKKSRRLQLLIKPSLYEKLKQRADAQTGGSVNEAINAILEDALREE